MRSWWPSFRPTGSFLQGAGRPLSDLRCTAPIDTTYDIAAQIASGGTEEAMFRNTFGNDPATWDHASPRPTTSHPARGSPASTSSHADCHHGSLSSQSFGTTLRNAGIDADVQVTVGLTHEEVNDAIGKAGDTVVTPPLMSFYRRCVTQPVT